MGSGTQLQRPYAARGEVDGQVPHSVPVMSAFSHHQNGPFPDVSNAAASVTNLDLDFPDLPFPVGSSAYDLSHEFLPNSRAMVVPEGLATSPAWGSIPESRQLGKTWLSRSASHEVGDAQILASRHAEIDGAGLEFATQTQRADSTGNLLEGDARGEHSWSNEKLQVKHTRRAEQNRRAQAKFRQRKKVQDKVSSMEMQLAAMSLHLQQVTNEKDALAQRALQLQQVVERKDAQLAAIEGQSKGSDASEDLIGAFWDMVVELKKGKPSLNCSRECIQKMVNDLLNSKSLELGFIRKEIVAQLAQCVEQGGDVEHSPANRWLNRLVTAYVRCLIPCCASIKPGANSQETNATGLFLLTDHIHRDPILPAVWLRILYSGLSSVYESTKCFFLEGTPLEATPVQERLCSEPHLSLSTMENANLHFVISPVTIARILKAILILRGLGPGRGLLRNLGPVVYAIRSWARDDLRAI